MSISVDAIPYQARLSIVQPAQPADAQDITDPIELLVDLSWPDSPLGPVDVFEVGTVSLALSLSTFWLMGELANVTVLLELNGEAIAQLTPVCTQRIPQIGLRAYSLWRTVASLPQTVRIGLTSRIALRVAATIDSEHFSRLVAAGYGGQYTGNRFSFSTDNAGAAAAASLVLTARPFTRIVLDSWSAKIVNSTAGANGALVTATSTSATINRTLTRLSTQAGENDSDSGSISLATQPNEGLTVAFTSGAASLFEYLQIQGHLEGQYDLTAYPPDAVISPPGKPATQIPGGYLTLIGTRD